MSRIKKIKVQLPERSYDILIGHQIIQKLFQTKLKKICPSKEIIFISNKTLAPIFRNKIQSILPKSFQAKWILIADGEVHKTLQTVESIYHQLLKLKAHRKTTLIALGGGVIGDITGFVAATYLRGVPFIQIPTSLLAQVDSSVGGKTGVDLKEGKNLVGAFYQPQIVLIDSFSLKTLPHREFLCGLSEIIKYGLIWDKNFFEKIEKNKKAILNKELKIIHELIHRSCQIKAEIVSLDEKESGLRSLLNLGHTLGHAIETLSGFGKILHGEAVAMGMVYAAKLSEEKGYTKEKISQRLVDLLDFFNMPSQWPIYSKKSYQKVLKLDKKASKDTINYIALRKIGKAFISKLSATEITQHL